MLTGSLAYLNRKKREYFTDFQLYPKSSAAPLIDGTPTSRFAQKTWIESVVYDPATSRNYAVLQNKTQLFNRVGMVQGTEFEIELPVYDLSILSRQGLDIYDDKNLEYKWTKNDSVLLQFSNVNNLKGTNKLLITSESCTHEVSGIYQLEVTNRKTGASSVSETVLIDVINLEQHSMLHNNLLKNGCGEQDMSGWSSESDILTQRFTNRASSRRHSSIPNEVYGLRTKPHYEPFYFTLSSNEVNLGDRYKEIMDPHTFDTGSTYSAAIGKYVLNNPDARYNRWIFNMNTCLVKNEDSRDTSGAFFPSLNYIDTYNKNNNLYKLSNLLTRVQTYITRDKIKFTAFGGKPQTTTNQVIDVNSVSDMIDGRVYGVNGLTSHFFAYVGIGISSYKLEYVDDTVGEYVEDNMIPVTMFDYKLGALNDKPAAIPFSSQAQTLLYNENERSKHPTYWPQGSFKWNATDYNKTKRDKYSKKIKKGTEIKITPVCYDKVAVLLDYMDSDNNILLTEKVDGPTEKDIWAVKEKQYIPMHIAYLYGWCTNAEDQVFSFYSQSYTTMNAIRRLDTTEVGDNHPKDIKAEWYKKYRYPLLDSPYYYLSYSKWEINYVMKQKGLMTTETAEKKKTNDDRIQTFSTNFGFSKNFLETNEIQQLSAPFFVNDDITVFDNGAAAFFAIQKDTEVPRGTKYIRVTVVFDHTSDAINDINPRQKQWTKQTIYYDVFSKGGYSEQTVDYGNPRAAITAMHLSLHPNGVEISEKYQTYKLDIENSVWGKELKRLENPLEYWSVVPPGTSVETYEYKYSQPTTPPPPDTTGYTPFNTTTVEQLYPGTMIVQSLPTIPLPIPTQSADTGSRAVETTPAPEFLQVTGSAITGSVSDGSTQ